MTTDGSVHVMPVFDLREHVQSIDCWCKPTEDAKVPGLFVHHSADGSEPAETVERVVS